jgi:hypothetical protein
VLFFTLEPYGFYIKGTAPKFERTTSVDPVNGGYKREIEQASRRDQQLISHILGHQ